MVPLLCFGGAATRIPLTTLGLMQYLTPTVQFLLGILFFHEPMPAMRWVGFSLIWLALVLFTVSALRGAGSSTGWTWPPACPCDTPCRGRDARAKVTRAPRPRAPASA